MRKHQFVKKDCACTRQATHFECKYCGTPEYRSAHELMRLTKVQAQCDHPDAPLAQPGEKFKAAMGGYFNCLATDYESYCKTSGRCAST